MFRLEGDFWALSYDGMTCWVGDIKGMRYVATLLARPGESVAVTDLASLELVPQGANVAVTASAAPHAVARSAEDFERARLNVTRAIKTAVQRIGTNHPRLGSHLAGAIRTGAFCVYLADAVSTWIL